MAGMKNLTCVEHICTHTQSGRTRGAFKDRKKRKINQINQGNAGKSIIGVFKMLQN